MTKELEFYNNRLLKYILTDDEQRLKLWEENAPGLSQVKKYSGVDKEFWEVKLEINYRKFFRIYRYSLTYKLLNNTVSRNIIYKEMRDVGYNPDQWVLIVDDMAIPTEFFPEKVNALLEYLNQPKFSDICVVVLQADDFLEADVEYSNLICSDEFGGEKRLPTSEELETEIAGIKVDQLREHLSTKSDYVFDFDMREYLDPEIATKTRTDYKLITPTYTRNCSANAYLIKTRVPLNKRFNRKVYYLAGDYNFLAPLSRVMFLSPGLTFSKAEYIPIDSNPDMEIMNKRYGNNHFPKSLRYKHIAEKCPAVALGKMHSKYGRFLGKFVDLFTKI